MTIQIDAVFHDGALWPKQPVSLPNGTAVRIAIEPQDAAVDPLAAVLGIGVGPEQGDAADRHDDHLYGSRPE